MYTAYNKIFVYLLQSELSGVQSAECERLILPLGGGESALRVCASLLGAGPTASPMHPHHLPGIVTRCTKLRITLFTELVEKEMILTG